MGSPPLSGFGLGAAFSRAKNCKHVVSLRRHTVLRVPVHLPFLPPSDRAQTFSIRIAGRGRSLQASPRTPFARQGKQQQPCRQPQEEEPRHSLLKRLHYKRKRTDSTGLRRRMTEPHEAVTHSSWGRSELHRNPHT